MVQIKKQELTIASCLHAISERNKVTRMQQDFDQAFNHIPMLFFAITFVTVPGFIASFSYRNTELNQVSVVIVYFVVEIIIAIMLIAIVLSVCKSKDRMDQHVDDIILLIQQKQSSESLDNRQTAALVSLMDVLRKSQEFHFTGGSLFKITRSLFLSFASALISISVLVLQMTSK